MEQEYLNDDIFDQIKDFNYRKLTEEQKSLIDKLIENEKLNERYKKYGLCKECKQPNTGEYWCQLCSGKRFQQNFKNWSSGNSDVDKLIQHSQLNARYYMEKLEWIEYDRFENIEYVAKGGFGMIYKAIWKDGYITNWDYENNQWKRDNQNMICALKCLNNSKDITSEFLNEINLHLKVNYSSDIIRIFGITKDSKTNDFMMVMMYAENGNLRKTLNNNFNSLTWENKIDILRYIANGLTCIHKEGLTHQDFHSGNILNVGITLSFITDLGLCKPANEKPGKKVYGVLPYVAPEVLKGKPYTKESDVYSFGIIIYEVITGLPPYYNVAHDEILGIKICQGLRPKFDIKVPQLIENIFKQCVDADPLKRPTAEYLYEKFNPWIYDIDNENSEIYKQTKEADEFNEKQITCISNKTEFIYETHPHAIYTSRLLKFNNLPEPKNTDDIEYSESTEIDFIKLKIQ